MEAESNAYVLDSFALLAYLQDEPGCEQVKAVLSQAEKQAARVYLSMINFGEAIYITEREKGLPAAQRLIAMVDQLPITVVDADRAATFAAAHINALYPVAYGDAFATALAQQKAAVVITGDPEFRKIETLVTVEWLAR